MVTITTDELLAKHQCPVCGSKIICAPVGNESVADWRELVVWCSDMGHWAGQLKDCDETVTHRRD